MTPLSPLYCSQGHDNPTTSRFCHRCGEALESPATPQATSGQILGDRYQVKQELGQGGFGRTYLAEDLNRFNELCVLKEFAPQVQGTYALQKAAELFEREAGVLYQLQHPQIPKFRELFRVQLQNQGRLFLVQDYVQGQTYRTLLDTYKSQGSRFSEPEVSQFLLQLLPVLGYIHAIGVIHRDISPDNLILRQTDWLPVLIDFGGVKQIAATVASEFTTPAAEPVPAAPGTRLGKIGYAPNEQMQLGMVSPQSDLYALGMTALVLLTGKEPHELLNPQTLTWQWQQQVDLSPGFVGILEKMVAHRPSDRYASAQEVLQALSPPVPAPTYVPTQAPASQVESPSPAQTAATSTAPTVIPTAPVSVPPSAPVAVSAGVASPHSASFKLSTIVGVGALFVATTLVGWWAGNAWVQSRRTAVDTPPTQPTDPPPTNPETEPPLSADFSAQERDRKEALGQRRRTLNINYPFFVSLVDQVFRETTGVTRALGTDNADADLRTQWDAIANQLLDQLANLSPEARRQLGRYTTADRDRWQTIVNNLHLSSRALYDLADGQFFHQFPQHRERVRENQPMDQVWHAIALDQVKAIQAGTTLETIRFDPQAYRHEVRGTLQPGTGKAYIAQLAKDQIVRLSVEADSGLLLSVYPPSSQFPPLLKSSPELTWSGRLDQSGYYEFIVISDAAEPVDYQLNLAADNISTSTALP